MIAATVITFLAIMTVFFVGKECRHFGDHIIMIIVVIEVNFLLFIGANVN